jgi:hypothetical protein
VVGSPSESGPFVDHSGFFSRGSISLQKSKIVRALIFASETKATAVADKFGAKLVSEVASAFVTGE